MQRTLSKQGARRTKLTVLIPDAVMDDLRALRMYTCQSTGDLINQLIEKEIEDNADAVREGRKLLAIEQERQELAKARREAARKDGAPTPEAVMDEPEDHESSDDAAAHDPEEPPAQKHGSRMPNLDDVSTWSQMVSKDEAKRRLTDGEEFVKWLRVTGRSGTLEDANEYTEEWSRSHPTLSKRTHEKHNGRIRSFVRWWQTQ